MTDVHSLNRLFRCYELIILSVAESEKQRSAHVCKQLTLALPTLGNNFVCLALTQPRLGNSDGLVQFFFSPKNSQLTYGEV